jgi:hypothetical protein
LAESVWNENAHAESPTHIVVGGEDREGTCTLEDADEVGCYQCSRKGGQAWDGLDELHEVGQERARARHPRIVRSLDVVGDEDGVDDVHDAVLGLDISRQDGRVSVDEDLAAGHDEDDFLAVKRGDGLEVADLCGVCTGRPRVRVEGELVRAHTCACVIIQRRRALTNAVVQQVVLEHLGELGRVREEVGEERRGELREGVVVGRKHRVGVALRGSALQERTREGGG